MRPIILVGGGGHCKSVINTIEEKGYKIKGILDTPDKMGNQVLGYDIIGTDDDIPKYVETCDFVVTLGFIKNPLPRIKCHEKVINSGGRFATIIAKSAHVSKHANIGEGTVILQNALVNAGATIGFGCIINTASNIEHDAVIGDYCHISTGVMVNGETKLGERCFVGSGAVLANCIEIASDSVIGAGALVLKTLKEAGCYIGNPLHKVK